MPMVPPEGRIALPGSPVAHQRPSRLALDPPGFTSDDDPAFVTSIQRQHDTFADPCPGVQSRELPAAVGPPSWGEALQPDDAAGQSDQDWYQGVYPAVAVDATRADVL